MKLEWSTFARDDLDDLARYIGRDSPFYARRFVEKIVLSARRLQAFPESGRMIPETEDKNLREIIVQGYCIMYRLEPDRVLVLAVMHGSRDLGGMADKPWDEN